MTAQPDNLPVLIEALLFTSGDPLSVAMIARATGKRPEEVEQAVEELAAALDRDGRGLRLLRQDNRFQLVTAPEASSVVAALVQERLREELSPAASETLAIIAYRGPITRAGIDAIRGVNTTFTLRLLAMRGLVEKVRNPEDSRSAFWRVTNAFLTHLGLSRIEDLPNYDELSRDPRVVEAEKAQ